MLPKLLNFVAVLGTDMHTLNARARKQIFSINSNHLLIFLLHMYVSQLSVNHQSVIKTTSNQNKENKLS